MTDEWAGEAMGSSGLRCEGGNGTTRKRASGCMKNDTRVRKPRAMN